MATVCNAEMSSDIDLRLSEILAFDDQEFQKRSRVKLKFDDETSHSAELPISAQFDFCDLCTGLTELIPTKSFNLDKGFVNERVLATCLDANDAQIAVGTNVGNVYIFSRRLRKMFTIKGRNKIECLKLSHNEVYALLGVGLETGVFVAVQLPSSDEGKSRKLLEKIVQDIHRSRISCIEWSPDGRKLFTGDASGLIMMTLIDFENNVFDSSFVYCDSEHCGIVQLTHWANFLAASTMAQAFLVDIADDCRVRLVGHSSKKSSTRRGVAFLYDDDQVLDIRPRLYVSRPACRLWRVSLTNDGKEAKEGDKDGVLDVLETQDYMPSISSGASLPIPFELQQHGLVPSPMNPTSAAGFGLLYHMANDRKDFGGGTVNLLITHDNSHLFLVDVRQKLLIASAQFCLQITDIAICSSTSEIFVLFANPESSPLILRISTTHADPWFVTSRAEEKPRKLSAEESVNVAAANVKGFLQKLKTGSSELVTKSADVFLLKEFDSNAPNFQIFLNKIRASSSESGDGRMGISMEGFGSIIDSATGALSSRPSSPDTVSLASGGGASLPPWCLEDQSLTESSTAISYRVRVTKSKARTGSQSRPSKSGSDNSKSLDSVSKSSSSDDGPVTSKESKCVADDRLTTPTEEKYLLNRFNPFDDSSAPVHPPASREQLEKLLDSTLLFQTSTPSDDVLDSVNAIAECIVADKADSMNSIGEERSLHSLDSFDLKKRINSGSSDSPESKKQPPPITTSFRQLLLNETRVAIVEEAEPIQPAVRRRTTTAEFLATPDDGSCGEVSSFGSMGVSGRDIWCQVDHDRPVVYISGSGHYFAFVDVDQVCRYFSYIRNNVTSGDLLSTTDKDEAWSMLQEKADAFAVSPNGRIVWRVFDEIAYGQLKPNLHAPVGRKWCEAGKEVSTKIAVSNSSAWYLKTDGTVCAQTQLRPDRPCFKIVHIDCEWPLVQLTCADDVVWGLRHDGRLVVRIGVKLPESPTGVDWIDFVPDGPSEVVALDIHDKTAWLIDTEGKLWFCKGVTSRHPIGITGRWWQVALPAPLSSNASAPSKRRTLPHAVCVTPVAVHLAVDRSIWYCRGGVTGHRWSRVIPMEWESVGQFRRLWTSCLFDELTDYIWLVRLNGEFMAFQPHSKRLQSLVAPCVDSEVLAISGALGYVWTLDALGRMFIRSGIDSVNCPLGSRWQMLDMAQFEGSPDGTVKFVHLSCSLDAVWACDQSGIVYVRLGVAPVECTGLSSAWVRLDLSDDDEVKKEKPGRFKRKSGSKRREMVVRKLFCTPDGSAVWALTRGGRIFVRLGITRDVPIGKKWAEIEDMRVRTLALGCDGAWALSEDFEIYQRYGISRENPAGNFWKPLSHKLRSVAVTPGGKLWGLDMDQRLVKHQTKSYIHGSEDTTKIVDDTSADSSTEHATDHELLDFEVV